MWWLVPRHTANFILDATPLVLKIKKCNKKIYLAATENGGERRSRCKKSLINGKQNYIFLLVIFSMFTFNSNNPTHQIQNLIILNHIWQVWLIFLIDVIKLYFVQIKTIFLQFHCLNLFKFYFFIRKVLHRLQAYLSIIQSRMISVRPSVRPSEA